MTTKRGRRSAPRVRAGTAAPLLARRILVGIFLMTFLPVLALRWLPPPTSAFMMHARLAALLEGRHDFTVRQQWTDWSQISPHAAMAVIASEDQLFREHHGFDFRSITRAMSLNQKGHTLRGASTITQQTAKNLFLYSGKSFWRKGLEAYFTVLMEALWPKRRILEVYLNIAQFGDGLYGIAAASEAFFHKPAVSLTAGEAALLAATLPNPIALRADKPSPYLLKRRQWILRQMRSLRTWD